MGKSTFYKTAGFVGVIAWAVAVFMNEEQPKAQSKNTAIVFQSPVKPFPMPPVAKVDNIVADNAPYVDSIRRQQRQIKQDAIDKKTPANLYMQLQINEKLVQANSDLRQALANQGKGLAQLQELVNRRPDTVYLTPQVIQVDTVYKGLVPIPQNSNRERKALEKTKEGVERFYRDSLRRGGTSQRIVGYQVS